MRPIDANALKHYMGIRDAVKYGNKTEEQRHNSYATLMNYEIADYIDNMPTLDLAPIKQADWLEHGCSNFCTRCGEKPLYDYFGKLKLSNFCPNCGAKMDGGKKDETA